jgi:oligosaccharide repeat unit polymerase
MVSLLLIVFYLALTGACLVALWPYRQGSPMFWFPALLALIAVGTIPLLDFNLASDRVYMAMFIVAMLTFVTTVFVYFLAVPINAEMLAYSRRPEDPFTTDEIVVSVGIFVLSVIITFAYFRAVGYNVLLLLITSNVEDYSSLRLESYSGENYFAPGYVNQFKNVLLPVTTLIISIYLDRFSEKKFRNMFIIFAWPVVFIGLAGTGQRGFLIYTLAAIFMAFSLRNAGRPKSKGLTNLFLIAVPVLILFTFMTGAYTGVGDSGANEILAKIIERIVIVQQEGGLFGFRYIYLLNTAWFTEWMQGFIGVVPKVGPFATVQGSSLSHDIYAALYGTDRGTAPLTAVGSAYYNGRIFGVIILYASMAIFSCYMYRRFIRGRKSVARMCTYGFIFLYISIYVSDSPVILIDNGILALVLFLILLKGRSLLFLGTRSATAKVVPPGRLLQDGGAINA